MSETTNNPSERLFEWNGTGERSTDPNGTIVYESRDTTALVLEKIPEL